jgi:monoamine oxidase
MGTVPHVPPGASGADFDLMAAPVPDRNGRLLFAGDATFGLFPGLVLGAFHSGRREAARIAGTL